MRLPLSPGVSIEQSLVILELGSHFARANELPRMRPSRKRNGATVELEKFKRLATRLRRHLSEMSGEALNALADHGERHALAVDDDLERMISRADAYATAEHVAPASTSPRRFAPEQTAQLCAQVYQELTGRRAKLRWNSALDRHDGPYLRFVQDVFAACGLAASAEHYARLAEDHTGPIGGDGGVKITRTAKKIA